MIVSLLLTVVGLGILAKLVIQLAIFELPAVTGLWAGLAAWHAGARPVGSPDGAVAVAASTNGHV